MFPQGNFQIHKIEKDPVNLIISIPEIKKYEEDMILRDF
jgi:hypothetical protein